MTFPNEVILVTAYFRTVKDRSRRIQVTGQERVVHSKGEHDFSLNEKCKSKESEFMQSSENLIDGTEHDRLDEK